MDIDTLPDFPRTTATTMMKTMRTRMDPPIAMMNLFLWSNLKGSFLVSSSLKV
jgi:hypothetical protein